MEIPIATEVVKRLRAKSQTMDAAFERRCALAIATMDTPAVYVDIQGIEFAAIRRVQSKLVALGYSVAYHSDQREGSFFVIRADT